MQSSLYTALTLALFSSLSVAAPAAVLEGRAQTIKLQLGTNGGGDEAVQERNPTNNVKSLLRNKKPLIKVSIVGDAGSCQFFNNAKPVGERVVATANGAVVLKKEGEVVTHAQCTLS